MDRELLGAHVICTNYGFWLPNEERGSGSDFVRSEALTKFGPANPVTHRRSVASKPYDREIRRLAKDALRYPEVILNGEQALSAATGIKNEIQKYGGTIWAYARLPDHEHYVIAPPRYDIRRFIGRLRGAATKQLLADGLHPLKDYRDRYGKIPSPWGRLPWVVYLWTEDDILRSVGYVKQNPLKQGLPKQHWGFVFEFPNLNPKDTNRSRK